MHSRYVASKDVTLETGAWLYGVHWTCTKMAAVSHGMSHVTKSALSTLLWWLFKTHSVKVQSVFQNHKQLKCSGTARKQREKKLYRCHCEALGTHPDHKSPYKKHTTASEIQSHNCCTSVHTRHKTSQMQAKRKTLTSLIPQQSDALIYYHNRVTNPCST